MQKKFFSNLILIVILNLLIKPFWIFGIEVEVQNEVGESVYGLYFVAFNLSLILNIFLDMGISNYNNKNIAQHKFLLQKHLGNIMAIRISLSVLYMLLVLIVALVLGWDAYKMYILSFLMLNQVLLAFILYLRSNLSALLLFRTDSFISILDKLLMILPLSFLLWGRNSDSPFQIEWLVYTQTGAYIVTFLVTLLLVLRKSGRINIKFSRPFFMAFFKQSYPYALLIFLMAFYNRIDSIFIDAILPSEVSSTVTEFHTGNFQSGLYARGYRILDGLSQFAYLFSVLLLPIFSRMIKEKANLNPIILLSFSLIIAPAIVVASSGSVFSEEIMNWLYPRDIQVSGQASGTLFSILIFGFIAISSTYIFGTLLTAKGSLKQLNIMASAGILINIAINLLLISRLEALGAVVSSLVTQSFTAIAQILIAVKVFKLKINYPFIFKLLLFFVVSYIVANICKNRIDTFGIAFFTSISISILIAFVLRILSVKQMFLILKEEQ